MQNRYYIFTRSRRLNITSWLTVAILVCTCALTVWGREQVPTIAQVLLVAVTVFASGLGYVLAPRYMYVGKDDIVIVKHIGQARIELKEVSAIEKIDCSRISTSFRTFGNSGLFAYMGKYYSKSLGQYTLISTDMSSLLLITTREGKYVVSCGAADEFIAQVESVKNNGHA